MSSNFANLFDTFDTFTSPPIPVNLIVRKIERLSHNELDPEFKDINIIHDVKSNTFLKLTGVEICGENIVNTGLVHLFIDNSNVFYQGKNLFGDDYRMIYPKLLSRALNTRNIGEHPIIVGSCLPPTLVTNLENTFIVKDMYDGEHRNHKEKRVDAELLLCISETIHKYPPGILVLVAGDGDYKPALERALNKNWEVEILFWKNGFSQSLKQLNARIEFLDDQHELFSGIALNYEKPTNSFGLL